MTPAASSSTALKKAPAKSRSLFAVWQLVPAIFAVLVIFLALAPDGVAEPLQTLASWLLIGGVAALAVAAIVQGLERLLDCESD